MIELLILEEFLAKARGCKSETPLKSHLPDVKSYVFAVLALRRAEQYSLAN